MRILAAILAAAVAFGLPPTAVVPHRAFAAEVELLAVQGPHCAPCLRWEKEVGHLYPRTDEARAAPLRRIDIGALDAASLAIAEPVRYTPTFLLLSDGRETGRITGYADEAVFWGLLQALLRRQPQE